MLGRRLLGFLAAAPAAGRAAIAADGQEPWQHRRAGDLVLHFAVVPAGAAGRHLHEVVVGVRDAEGRGVADAAVAAVVRGGAHPGAAALALARRPGTSDWAAAVTLLPRDAYRFEVEVRRPGLPPVSAGFVHRQLQP